MFWRKFFTRPLFRSTLKIEIRNYTYPAVLFALALIALLAGGILPYFFFFLLLFVFLVPCLWLAYGLRGLRGSIEISTDRAEVGDWVDVRYTLINSTSGRFPYLELSNLVGSSLQLPAENQLASLAPGSTAAYERQVRCLRRGKYFLEDFRVKTGDPFGFFKLSKSIAAGEAVNVYPRVRLLKDVYISTRQQYGDFRVREQYLENQSLLSDLRLWQAGDSYKKIHWKQTARQGRMVIKNFEKKGDAAPKIFLDMIRESYRGDRDHLLEDLAVEAAASYIYYCLQAGISLEFYSEALAGGRVTGSKPGDYLRIMDRVITLSPVREGTFSAAVAGRCHYLAPTGTLYLLTPKLELGDAAVYYGLRQKGFYLVLVYLAAGAVIPQTSELISRLRRWGIKVQVIYPEEVPQDAGQQAL